MVDPVYGPITLGIGGTTVWQAFAPDGGFWSWVGTANPQSPSGFWGTLNFAGAGPNPAKPGTLTSYNPATSTGVWTFAHTGYRVDGTTPTLTQS